MRVLVAGGDNASLRILGASLEKLRHEVHEAGDGRRALELYASHDFELVVADWQMPRMSGLDLCKAIREDGRGSSTYVVIVTTLSAQENTLDGFRAGADDYLVKPFSVEQLETRLVVAERVCHGADEAAGTTMRDLVEMCRCESGAARPALRERVAGLAERYRTRRAYSKARAFLRRQIVLSKECSANRFPALEVERFSRELDLLQSVEEEST